MGGVAKAVARGRGRLAQPNLLKDARAYLSGPMDFVASRADEKRHGWRTRVGEFLRELGVTVFDPWFKPEVRGLHEYGREGEATAEGRSRWSFAPGEVGARARSALSAQYWRTMHIDLRMVDVSDFLVAYCPTNIYSVGTPHELVVCRQQHKPVLFVSPAVDFPALEELRAHLAGSDDGTGLRLLERLEADVPIKPNPSGTPSLWYMPLIGPNTFFDGFGFEHYVERFGWQPIALDKREKRDPPENPLLPYLEQLNGRLPEVWDDRLDRYAASDDWLLFDLDTKATPGAEIRDIHGSGSERA